jgi:hypothetical protein
MSETEFEEDKDSELLLSDSAIDGVTYIELVGRLTERYRRHELERSLKVKPGGGSAPHVLKPGGGVMGGVAPQVGVSPQRPIRRILLIGINYMNSPYQLGGCINDTLNLRSKLESSGVLRSDLGDSVIVMTDESVGNLYPSRANILSQLGEQVKWSRSVKGAVELIILYSGHGSNVVDVSRDEVDRRDEVLCPVDFKRSGFITDDQLRNEFLLKLGSNVSVVLLMDACNSGTICDLRYSYNIDARNSYVTYGYRELTNVSRCICLSACRDDQTAMDAWLYDGVEGRYEAQGALTASFIACYDGSKSLYSLLNSMRVWIKEKGYKQIVQLSSGRWLNTLGSLF